MRIVLFVVTLMVTNSAFAEWRDWWLNANQRGIELLNNGDAAAAAEVFSDTQWRGMANFQAGEYEQAAQSFAKAESSTSALYNSATALAHAGKLKESLRQFDELLTREPQHDDGIANRDWVLKQLQQQQQQENSNERGDQQGQQQGDQSEQQSGENGNQNKQQQAGASGEDGRELSKDGSAGSGQTQAQQSAEESLKSALGEQPAKLSEQGDDDPREQTDSHGAPDADVAFSEQSFNESAQAVEQQLKRIPDDPAGLLRNKLYVTHQSRFADIREGDEPW